MSSRRHKALDLVEVEGFELLGSLAVTYFRTRECTIIGATSFHGPVRDGKGWVQSAMAAKRNLYHGAVFGDVQNGKKEVVIVCCTNGVA